MIEGSVQKDWEIMLKGEEIKFFLDHNIHLWISLLFYWENYITEVKIMQVNRIFVEKFNVLQDELELCECGGRDKMIYKDKTEEMIRRKI